MTNFLISFNARIVPEYCAVLVNTLKNGFIKKKKRITVTTHFYVMKINVFNEIASRTKKTSKHNFTHRFY